MSNHVHLRFMGPRKLGYPKASKRATQRVIRVDTVTVYPYIGDSVWTCSTKSTIARDQWSSISISTCIKDAGNFSRYDGAVFLNASLKSKMGRVFRRTSSKFFVTSSRISDRCTVSVHS